MWDEREGLKVGRVKSARVGVKREGEGGTYWEIRIDIYTLPCIK